MPKDVNQQENEGGGNVYETYFRCVEDCAVFHIPTMVIHLPADQYPVNKLGLKRLEKIIHKAEDEEIQIAFENLSNINNHYHKRHNKYCRNIAVYFDKKHADYIDNKKNLQ